MTYGVCVKQNRCLNHTLESRSRSAPGRSGSSLVAFIPSLFVCLSAFVKDWNNSSYIGERDLNFETDSASQKQKEKFCF